MYIKILNISSRIKVQNNYMNLNRLEIPKNRHLSTFDERTKICFTPVVYTPLHIFCPAKLNSNIKSN